MRDPNLFTNWPSEHWLTQMADEEYRADPTPPYVVHVQRDAMAGAAVLTPVTSEHPLLVRICETCED